MIEYNGKQYDDRYGGPFDRGAADSYYGRGINPHYYKGNSYSSERVEFRQMADEELEAYMMGYKWNEEMGDRKSYD